MKKKFIGLLIIMFLPTAFVGCSGREEIIENNSQRKIETEERSDLKGFWAKEYNREEIEKLSQENMDAIKLLTETYGLSYEGPKEQIKKEGNDNVNSYYIEVVNEAGEQGTIDSMLYEFKKFGSDVSAGQISLKIGYHIDKANVEVNGFDLDMTSVGDYSEAVTRNVERDYTSINEELTKVVKEGVDGITLENNAEGLLETIMISKEQDGEYYLIYKLESNVYKFNK